jgi:hypothetical protein
MIAINNQNQPFIRYHPHCVVLPVILLGVVYIFLLHGRHSVGRRGNPSGFAKYSGAAFYFCEVSIIGSCIIWLILSRIDVFVEAIIVVSVSS